MFEIHIISLFPESIKPYLDTSIMQRAQSKGLFRYYIHNLANFSVRNTRRVDDRPYGGWAGTLITIEPLVNCIRELMENFWEMPIILTSPKWKKLNQKLSYKLSEKSKKYIIICWHYEGVDARIFDIFPIQEISIWDYVLSSWEIAALVIIDSIVRLIPWVISEESLKDESFSLDLNWKKEYPQYSRPEVFEWLQVPKILLSGDLKKIQDWKNKNLS